MFCGVTEREILGHEVDVEQTAGQVLEVPPALGRRMLGDTVAHVGDVADQRRGVTLAAKGGLHVLGQAFDQFHRAVDHAHPRQRHVLPRPRRLRVIGFESLQRIGERPGAPRRPQAHVDLVERALVGVGGQRRHDLLAESGVVLDRRQGLRAVGHFHAGRYVVDEDQVEVGSGRHLAAAELAQAKNSQSLALEAAMGLSEALLHAVAERGNRGGGDVGIGEAGLGRGVDALELLDALLAAAVIGPAACQIEDILLVVDAGKRRGEICRHLRGRGQRPVEVGREHRIQKEGAAREVGREARRAAHDRGQQFEQRRVGLEQREELHPGRQVAEEQVEVQQSLVRCGRASQLLQQAGHQFGQELAGAGRRGRAEAAMMPASYDAGGCRGIAKAQRLQGLQRARIVVGAGEDQVPARLGASSKRLA